MNREQATAIANQYFPFYPSVNEFHVTGDEQAFEDADQAKEHDANFFSIAREVEEKHNMF